MTKLFLLLSIFFTGCLSISTDVPEDATPQLIIQKAQTAYSEGYFSQAIELYQVLLERYGDSDSTYMVTAYYEIGLCYKKLNNTDQAIFYFEDLLEFYQNEQLAPFLPEWPRVLAQKILEEELYPSVTPVQ